MLAGVICSAVMAQDETCDEQSALVEEIEANGWEILRDDSMRAEDPREGVYGNVDIYHTQAETNDHVPISNSFDVSMSAYRGSELVERAIPEDEAKERVYELAARLTPDEVVDRVVTCDDDSEDSDPSDQETLAAFEGEGSA